MSLLPTISSFAAEAIWPTRCVVCDLPGHLLCPSCSQRLSYIDQWKACPICGAPYGMYQCTECNTYSLKEIGLRRPPFRRCVSAVEFDARAARIIKGRKDEGERRLSDVMAYYITCAIPPEWVANAQAICSIPPTKQSLRIRGYDHGALLAHACAAYMNLPANQFLSNCARYDQRALDRAQRFTNMAQAFVPLGVRALPESVIVVDDVYTTGATIMAAALSLRSAGVKNVYAATFAHVYRN